MGEASRDLNDGAFKLWIFLSANIDGFHLELSSKAMLNEFGIKKAQYDNAVKELIAKGYLVDENASHPPEDVLNYFGFYQIPQKTTENKEEKPKENTKVITIQKPIEKKKSSSFNEWKKPLAQSSDDDFDFG